MFMPARPALPVTVSLMKRSDTRGFSYLLLLFLVAMLSVSALAVRLVDVTELQQERERELLFVGRQFQNALISYSQEGGGGINAYPTRLEQLLEDDRQPQVRRHLRKVFVDPMTGTRNWGLQRVGDRIVGVYSQSAGKPLKKAGFDTDFAAFADAQHYSDWVFGMRAETVRR